MFQYNAVHDPKAFVFDLEGLYFLNQVENQDCVGAIQLFSLLSI